MSPPRVVYKEEGGKRLEPLEEVICEVDDEQMGSVIEVHPHKHYMRTGRSNLTNTYGQTCIMPWPDFRVNRRASHEYELPMHRSAACLRDMPVQALALRKAELKEMVPLNVAGKQRLVFEAPSRGLIGFRSAFATLTRGTGILHRAFSRYGPYKGPPRWRAQGRAHLHGRSADLRPHSSTSLSSPFT